MPRDDTSLQYFCDLLSLLVLVLADPQTRVSLFLKFAVANSDYINANFIRGYRDMSKSYIATQGPLQWTVADFWRMVWEQRASTIIMVTGLEERGMVSHWNINHAINTLLYKQNRRACKASVLSMNQQIKVFLL